MMDKAKILGIKWAGVRVKLLRNKYGVEQRKNIQYSTVEESYNIL